MVKEKKSKKGGGISIGAPIGAPHPAGILACFNVLSLLFQSFLLTNILNYTLCRKYSSLPGGDHECNCIELHFNEFIYPYHMKLWVVYL